MSLSSTVNPKTSSSSKVSKPYRSSMGLTRSKGGVPLKPAPGAVVGKGRKKRKHYPPAWGCAPDQMKMRRRVLCVFDGPRRLWKDEMMLDNEFEVRMKLGQAGADDATPEPADAEGGVRMRRLQRSPSTLENPNYYVTDLDVATVARANALLGAADEEKGPWAPDGLSSEEVERLMFCDRVPTGSAGGDLEI
jgi:hypothetical protein